MEIDANLTTDKEKTAHYRRFKCITGTQENRTSVFFSSSNHAFIAQRNLAERARPLALHSSVDGRIGLGAISR